MRILIAAIHYPVASARYIADAFRRLGCDVRTIGSSTGGAVWGLDVGDRYAWHSAGPLTAYWPDWSPDLVVVAESAWAFHHPVYQDVPHVVWGVDNHVRDYRQAGIAHYFLAHNAPSLMDMSAPDVTWLPCAYDPAHFTPSVIPWSDRAYDVALVGVPYPRRQRAVEMLGKAGLKVFAGTGLLYDRYADAYHNARIALSISAAGDVAQRIFETAALGCLVLSDPAADLAALDAQGIVTFADDSEIVPAAKALLKDADAAAETIAQSLDWVSPHIWDQRAHQVMDWFYATYRKPSPRPEGGKRK